MSSGRLGRFASQAGGWLLVACLVACGAGNLDGHLGVQVRDLQEQTVPPGSSLVSALPVTRDAWAAEATWEVEAPMTWNEYMQRLRSRLPGFVETPDAVAGTAHFTRTLTGDTHTLRVETLALGPPLRVRVIFRSLAS